MTYKHNGFATRRMCRPSSACCLQTGPLRMMFCVVSDCLVSCVMPTAAATATGLSDNRALKNWPVSPPHHAPSGSGPYLFPGAFFLIQLIQQLNRKRHSPVTVRSRKHTNLLSMCFYKTSPLLIDVLVRRHVLYMCGLAMFLSPFLSEPRRAC